MAGQIGIVAPSPVVGTQVSVAPGRMVADKNPWQSQTELSALIGALASILSLFGLITLTAPQVAGISLFVFVLTGVLRMTGDGAKLVFTKSKVIQDVVVGVTPTLADLNEDIGLATMQVDKIRAAMIAAGMSEEQVLAFLNGLGMNPAQTQAAVTAVKKP